MNWTRDCAAVIPCFNEAVHIGKVVTAVQKHLSKVIVVDDGSTDATSELAKSSDAEIVRLPNNSGKGAALQKGWQRASELGSNGFYCWTATASTRPMTPRIFLNAPKEPAADWS